MASILETVGLDAQANCSQFADWLARNNMKVGVFQIGPYQVGEGTNATVALTTELLERKGYRVDLSINILTVSANPIAPKSILITAMAILVVRAPLIERPPTLEAHMYGRQLDGSHGVPFEP